MRGALVAYHPGFGEVRIIPADAGSTFLSMPMSRISWDHPRGCGEHWANDTFASARAGSSPRMRGAPFTVWSQRTTTRIIPADAGSTSLDGDGAPIPRDHPRGCGEH